MTVSPHCATEDKKSEAENQYNTIQYNTIQYRTVKFDIPQCVAPPRVQVCCYTIGVIQCNTEPRRSLQVTVSGSACVLYSMLKLCAVATA